ncbi:hypothetical protein DH21_20335 [Serratia marcescens]|nr:hypothetical protein DH21_20335 [Serratia marcescens]
MVVEAANKKQLNKLIILRGIDFFDVIFITRNAIMNDDQFIFIKPCINSHFFFTMADTNNNISYRKQCFFDDGIYT